MTKDSAELIAEAQRIAALCPRSDASAAFTGLVAALEAAETEAADLREVSDTIEKARALYRHDHGTWDDLALAVAGVLGFDIGPARPNRVPTAAEALESNWRRAAAAAGFVFEGDGGRGAAPHSGGTVATSDIFPEATS